MIKKQDPIVLMYHGIISEWTALPKGRDAGADLYDVPTHNFLDQMEWLKNHGFTIDTLKGGQPPESEPEGPAPEVERGVSGAGSGGRRIILTFDDGEMNNYEQVLPVLQKCGFPAYFFVIARRVGGRGYMGWDELRALHEAGMVIGSHGYSHEILTNLLDSQVQEELRASKRYLERNLDIAVDAFSVPRGFCNDKVIQMAYETGYKHVFISDRPRALRSSCYSRVAVRSRWPLKRFELAVEGNVPPLEKFNATVKSAAKRLIGERVYDWVRRVLVKI